MTLDKRGHRSLVLWATDCAEHVRRYFEERYPNDNPPLQAVDAGRAWPRGGIVLREAGAARAAVVVVGELLAAPYERG